jgi:hypothetical protein
VVDVEVRCLAVRQARQRILLPLASGDAGVRSRLGPQPQAASNFEADAFGHLDG